MLPFESFSLEKGKMSVYEVFFLKRILWPTFPFWTGWSSALAGSGVEKPFLHNKTGSAIGLTCLPLEQRLNQKWEPPSVQGENISGWFTLQEQVDNTVIVGSIILKVCFLCITFQVLLFSCRYNFDSRGRSFCIYCRILMNLSESRSSTVPWLVSPWRGFQCSRKRQQVTDIQTCGAFSLVYFCHVAYLHQSQYTTQKAGEIVFTHMVACHNEESSFEDFLEVYLL